MDLVMDPVRAARIAALRDPSSSYFQQSFKLLRALREEMKVAKVAVVARNRLVVDVGLASGEISFLEGYFEYEVSSKPSGAACFSPFMEAFGRCMHKRVMDVKSWPGEEVLVMEGDLRQVVVRAASWMHVCRFGRTSMDVVRYVEEDNFVRRTVRSKVDRMRVEAIAVVEQLDGRGTLNVCCDGTVCTHECDTVVVQPVHVRPGLRQVVKWMEQHGARRAKGWFFFCPEMLVDERGSMLDGRVRFVVDKERGEVSVYDSASDVPYYVYSMMNMLSFLRNRVYEEDGVQCYVELHGQDEGVVEWLVTMADEVLLDKPEECVLPLWASPKMQEENVLMSFMSFVPGEEEKGAQQIVLRSNARLVESICSRLMVKQESAITLGAARLAVKDFSDQYIELGGFVKLPRGLNGVVAEFLARGCCRRAKYAKVAMLLEQSVAGDAYKSVSESLRGTYVSGLCGLASSTGKTLLNVMKMPVTEVLTAGRSETWDVSIVAEDPVVLLKWSWEPSVRGSDKYGSVGDCIGPRVEGGGRHPVIRQAWEWYSHRKQRDGETEVAAVVVEREVERKPAKVVLGAEREDLVASLTVAYDARSVEHSRVGVCDLVPPRQPQLTPAVLSDDPYSAMQEDFDVNMPGVAMCDFGVRTFLTGVSDREYGNVVAALKTSATEQPPRDTEVFTSVLKSGVSGPRPVVTSEAAASFAKRVGGAPDYQHPVVLKEAAEGAIRRFTSVCFVEGWEGVVKSRVAAGLWQPSERAVRDVVAKMKPSNVKKAAGENFSMADVIMTEYQAMVKRQPKDKLERGAAFEQSACQTIVYQASKSTNALFSSILGEVHDLIDDLLRPGILINARKDKSFCEGVWNATKGVRDKLGGQKIDVDISQCDKSQTGRNMMLYFQLLDVLGMPRDLGELWEITVGLKTATVSGLSFRVSFLYQVVSGLFYTISANSCIVAVASLDALESVPGEVINFFVSGDDVMYVSTRRRVLMRIAERFSTMYNFEAKVFEPEVLYWCGRYIVEVDGYEFFVKDPERLFSMLARDQPSSYDAEEAYDAFLDDTQAYAWEELVVGVAHCVKKRQERSVAPVSMSRGIATVRQSKELFKARLVGKKLYAM